MSVSGNNDGILIMEKTVVDFRIVQDNESERMMNAVKKALSEGWVLHGHMFVKSLFYCQPMVKYNE